MPSIEYWVALTLHAMQHMAARPHILPADVLEAVEVMGGVEPFVSSIVPSGDPSQRHFMLVTIWLCRQLCACGLGGVGYLPHSAAAAA
jgi:hypothetical protein